MESVMHIDGVRTCDDKWKEMQLVYDACLKAGITVPKQVQEFFGYEKPDELGVLIRLDSDKAVEEWGNSYAGGYQIDLTKLQKGFRYLRIYFS